VISVKVFYSNLHLYVS